MIGRHPCLTRPDTRFPYTALCRSGGTLFLDEIAELPLPMQVKLLRAIQEKSVRPVGASAEVPVDVRILSATHKDLAALVASGSFRHDLYYRINEIGRAHVCTPVTNAQLVCRLLLEKQKQQQT